MLHMPNTHTNADNLQLPLLYMEICEKDHPILVFRRNRKITNINAINIKTAAPITPFKLRVVSTTGVSACEADGVFVGGESGAGEEVVISIAVLVG